MKNEDIFNETKIELEEYLIKHAGEESEMVIMMIEESECKRKTHES